MKKLLSFILVMMAFAFQASAEETQTENNTICINFEYKSSTATTRHRSPMRINIEAWYNSDSNTIDIIYDGETEGEVILYLNDNIVVYDSTINTSLSLPTTHGTYRIEIVTDNWTAEGGIQL